MSLQYRTTVYRDVRPMGGAPVDLVVVDGRIAQTPLGEAHVVDCGGRIALPTLVDAHIHPDKTTWGEPWVTRRPAQGIADLARQDADLFRALDTPVEERAGRLMAHAVAQGTRAMRAHADVAPDFGLAGVAALGEVRARLAHALDVQIVAFPQHGVRRAPGTEALLDEAARTGAVDLVGGIDPGTFDDDPQGQLDLVFGIADLHGVGVDIHLHDRGEPGLTALRGIIERTRALDMGGRVTVSHAFRVPEDTGEALRRLADDLADAGVGLTTVAPSPRSVLPTDVLLERGVRVGLGSDGVRDSWSPFGNADMLHRAHLLARCRGARLDEDLSAAYLTAAHDGADLLSLPRADFTRGAPADFLLVEGECLPQIVVDVPDRWAVVRAGHVVARDGAMVQAHGA
ncbi:amidohydrolase [Nocardiopsis aegyptia]|uniref:amidohydrolase n=1 Tax=Nocardiopsis aegyptia TaxID=220378 RepID=UPI0036714304